MKPTWMLALSLFAIGCVDSTDGEDTSDSDTNVDNTVAECVAGETFDGATLALDGLQLVTITTNLSATGFQPFSASTCDWTFGDNLLNIFQTGADNGWDEEHVIPSTSHTEGDATTPRGDTLELAITAVATIPELTGDDKTLFDSGDDGSLTYAMRVFNADGSLADCLAWGHDVPGMFAGDVPDNNTSGHTDFGQISSTNCGVASR